MIDKKKVFCNGCKYFQHKYLAGYVIVPSLCRCLENKEKSNDPVYGYISPAEGNKDFNCQYREAVPEPENVRPAFMDRFML